MNKETNKKNIIFEKTFGLQIRNLMASLNITHED